MMWPQNLLELPAREAASRIALEYLRQATDASQRMANAAADEALHDFRVSLRRLRTCLRAYDDIVDEGLPRKARKRLKAITTATSRARDVEVQLAWLHSEIGNINPGRRPALLPLQARLEAHQKLAYETIRGEVLPDFQRLERRLRKALARLLEPSEDGTQSSARFAHVVAPLVHQHALDLKAYLTQVKSIADMEEAHLARISAKRLRYLLEPIASRLDTGEAMIQELKALQDLLGGLRDVQLFAAELAAAMEEAAVEKARRLLQLALQDGTGSVKLREAQRRNEYAGFLAAARLAQQRQEQLFARIREEYGSERVAAFALQLIGLADQLAVNLVPLLKDRTASRQSNRSSR